MRRADPRLGRRPGALRIASPESRSVAEVTSSPWAGAARVSGERHGRVEPMPVQADIAVAGRRGARGAGTARGPGDCPVRRRLRSTRAQHRLPGGQRVERAAVRERQVASIRLRVALSSSSASSSSRAARRSRSVASGSAMRRQRARQALRPRRAAPASTGYRSHSSVVPARPRRRRRRGPAPAGGACAGTPRSDSAVPAPAPASSGRCVSASRVDQPGAGRARAACKRGVQRRLQRRPAGHQLARAAGAGRARASGRPRRPAASAAVRPSPRPRARPKRRCRRRRTGGGLRRTRSGSAPCASSSPPQAACAITRAWLATTSSAVRARRIVCSTKQRRQCGQAAWMHSPRRSARPSSSAGAEQFGEPAGQVAALDVAVGGRQRPARDQAERHDGDRHQPGHGRGDARPPGSAGRGSSPAPCAPRRAGGARRGRGTGGPARRRSGAAGGG